MVIQIQNKTMNRKKEKSIHRFSIEIIKTKRLNRSLIDIQRKTEQRDRQVVRERERERERERVRWGERTVDIKIVREKG